MESFWLAVSEVFSSHMNLPRSVAEQDRGEIPWPAQATLGFLSFGAYDYLMLNKYSVGGSSPVLYRMLSSISGLYAPQW